MDISYSNRIIAIGDMLDSPLPIIRKEGYRLLFELIGEYKEDTGFLGELDSLVQRHPNLTREFHELAGQYPSYETEIGILDEKIRALASAAGSQEAEIVREINKRFYVLTDQAIGADSLNYQQYADAFSELVCNPDMTTPITVGIYGHWGKGKSFLMRKIRESINKQNQVVNNAPSSGGKINILTIEFNAWSYSSSDHLWAGMVTHLYNDVEKYLRWKVPWHRFTKALRKSWRKALSLSFFYVLLGLGLSLLMEYNKIQRDFQTVINAVAAPFLGGSALASLPILWSALKDFTDTLFLSRANNLQNLAARHDFREQIGVMADIKNEIGFISDVLNRNTTRLVLFIDDLDRCDHKKAVEVLQAIMLLLADRDGSPFVIFLGIDARVIVRAIEENYGEVLVKAGITGYEYLDKIIQVPFVIPPAGPKALGNYLESLLWASAEEKNLVNTTAPESSGNLPEVNIPQQEVPAASASPRPTQAESEPVKPALEVSVTFSKAEREAIMKCISDFCDNPRKIKRIVNMYRLARLLIREEKPEREKVIRWILLTEQWPLHSAWIIHSIEDDLQSQKVIPETPIKEVYQKVKSHIHSDEMQTIFGIDYDPTLFEIFIEREPGFQVIDVLNLLPTTFNLNPAIRWEVESYANRLSGNALQSADNSDSNQPPGASQG